MGFDCNSKRGSVASVMISIRYFACRGRVEPLRLLFIEGNVKWEENPLTDLSSWANEKPTTPFGSLPIVKDGEKELTQTMAILRHYARKNNFFGSDPDETLRVDMMIEAVLEAQEKLASKYYWNPNWEEERQNVIDTIAPSQYANLQKFFELNYLLVISCCGVFWIS